MLGFALLFSGTALTRGLSLGVQPSWHEIAFALPLAMLAYTGLETVANLAEETRRPGRDLPRSLFSAVTAVVLIYVLISLVGLSAYPAPHGTTALGTDWERAPLMGIVSALQAHLPEAFAHVLRIYVGLTGALVLLTAATTSVSGFGRLAYSLGEHGQLPRVFGRLHRRTLVSPQAMIAATAIAIGLLLATSFLTDTVSFLASLFSFGVLLAFTAAQLAVIRLRVTEPELRRPFRVPLGVRDPRRRDPAAVGRRRARHGRRLRRRDLDAHRRALRRPGLARLRARRLPVRAALPRRGAARARRGGGRAGAPGAGVLADSRADEAR